MSGFRYVCIYGCNYLVMPAIVVWALEPTSWVKAVVIFLFAVMAFNSSMTKVIQVVQSKKENKNDNLVGLGVHF